MKSEAPDMSTRVWSWTELQQKDEIVRAMIAEGPQTVTDGRTLFSISLAGSDHPKRSAREFLVDPDAARRKGPGN